LEFCARLLATFGVEGCPNRSVEVESGRTLLGVGLGGVRHSHMNYATAEKVGADYQSTCTRAYAKELAGARLRTGWFAIIAAVIFLVMAARVIFIMREKTGPRCVI